MAERTESAADEDRQSATSELPVPDWVPGCLRPHALKIYARDVRQGHLRDAALVKRLLTDERMKRVWRELLKHKRGEHHARTAKFHKAARVPIGAARGSTGEMQDRALQELFFKSLHFVREPWLTGEGEHYTEMAAHLRKDAACADEQTDRKHHATGAPLREAATAYDAMNDLLRSGHERWLAMQIAGLMEEIFGIAGYRSTATIVSVALETEITPSRVREWCRSTRTPTMGKKAKKRGAAPDSEGKGQ